MDSTEALAKATIAAALISRGVVEVPRLPQHGEPLDHSAGLRLRQLTDYVYRIITIAEPGPL
jgi:hypothetical protein